MADLCLIQLIFCVGSDDSGIHPHDEESFHYSHARNVFNHKYVNVDLPVHTTAAVQPPQIPHQQPQAPNQHQVLQSPTPPYRVLPSQQVGCYFFVLPPKLKNVQSSRKL